MGLDAVGPGTKTLLIDMTPSQTAGDVLALDCLQLARALGVQDYGTVARAVAKALSTRRKG